MNHVLKQCLHAGAALALLCAPAVCGAQNPAVDVAWALHSEPKTFDAAKVDDQSSETVRYLTGGVLIRINRQTLQPEPSLAERWSISADGCSIRFQLRSSLRFSDGSPLTSEDVVATLRRVLDPATAAPVSEEFVEPRSVRVQAVGPLGVMVTLARRVTGVERIFDEIAIEPAGRAGSASITAGPFFVAAVKPGDYVLLERNRNYWRKDALGQQLPYLHTLRLDTVSNRDIERMRFLNEQYQLVSSIAPEEYDDLAKRSGAARDLGPSLNTEQMWFNQSPASPLPPFEKSWFQNVAFRQAVSMAIRRADLARIAYKGHAMPAYGFISPANRDWYNPAQKAIPPDTAQAAALLAGAGFHKSGNALFDASGNRVRFSIVTNAGNTARERMGEMIAQDLAALGMEVKVVRLDFPALIDRLMHTQDYEAALLGLTNVDPDPNSMRNVWLSSSANHQWNPSQKAPATAWEAEIDRLMQTEASATEHGERKRCIDRLQQIVQQQQPFIYLVHPNLLYAASPSLLGLQLSVLQPGVISAMETVRRKAGSQ